MFRINCTEQVAKEGRSELTHGLDFFRHPNSSFQIVQQTPTLATPDLTHSPRRSARSTSPNTPSNLIKDDSFQLGSVAGSQHTVTISKFIGPGYLWDFWLGEHSQLGAVVLKLVYLPNYPCNRPEYDDYIPASDIIKEALKEESFYLDPLAISQGELVPRYHGLYHTSPGSHHIGMLLEYAGHALGPGIALLDEEWKNKVYSAYAKLHLHGVLHHDVSTQHILIDDRQRVRFVSFRRSTRKDLTVERDVRVLMIEAMKVRIRIGLERIQNVNSGSVPSSYFSHLENPTRFIENIRAEENAPEPDWVVEQKRRLREMPPPPCCTYESYE